ncbi:hypothetical protein HTV80_16245 [Streptomyces sp. Vc74B-19]|uniref:hypothetical protein n=1 Tax=unclassified Streptomyces TaxID=2593676 RepID=UPI001BFC1D8B|nr:MULTISPECIES: hypothetical protein [unclassified Streptomyces]MBT3164648.1 hypothetical protein [Streptomyces sp. Vc74B-19]MCO4696802.1 hypothetical protein [Streptomyces sp. RO-S4]
MNHLPTEEEPDAGPAETGRLREALAAAAYGVTPSRAPLADVERRGRTIRRRRRTTVLGAGCGLLLVPLAFVVVHGPDDDADRTTRPAATVSASPTPTPSPTASQRTPAPTPRVVAPGERVTAAPGFVLWLTKEGKHWTTPDMPEFPQFRSVVDGNIDRSTPGVSVQSYGDRSREYLSGLYYGGEGTASVVEVGTADGVVRGHLLELPGRPGWGVWYAVTDDVRRDDDDPFASMPSVTVRDTEGRVYAQSPRP